MDKRYIEENEIEIKYLRNQLNPDELEEFEVYLMENPGILDELNLDQLMVQGASVSKKAESEFKPLFIWSIFGNWRLVNTFASFALGMVIMAIFAIERGPVNSVEIQYLIAQDSLRGIGDSPTVEFEFPKRSFQSSSLDQFVLVVEPSDSSRKAFSVTISVLEGELKSDVVFTSDEITTNSAGRIALTLKTRDFLPSEYLIELNSLRGRSNNSINARFKVALRGN